MKQLIHHRIRRVSHVLLALLLAGLLLPAHGALAQAADPNSITVNSTADAPDADLTDDVCDADAGSAVKCSLRAAIMTANHEGGAQTIQVPQGTYRLTIKQLSDPNVSDDASGDLDITSEMTIIGIGGSKPVIDAAGLGKRVFQVFTPDAARVRLQNLAIRGGDEGSNGNSGGGIAINGRSQVTIEQSVITDNVASSGGGIFASFGSSLTIVSSRVQNNLATSFGGGGISTEATMTIRTSTISGNRADKDSGGGIRLGGSQRIGVNITQSTISGNTAERGGGIISGDVNLLIKSSTVSGNTATIGGGIQAFSSVFLGNVTLARNVGGGITSSNSVLGFSTIIASNGQDCSLAAGAAINGDGNLAGDRSCPFAEPSANKSNLNPVLGPLQFNGGETRTHALLAGSPAIGGGKTNCAFVDQRGFSRPVAAKCDIGAFQTSAASVGIAIVAPAQAVVPANTTTALTVTWTHPNRWRDLNTVDVQLRADEAMPLWVRFTEGVTDTGGLSMTNGLALYNSDGTLAGVGEPGQALVLESDTAALDLAQSRVQDSGPDGKTVTLTLAVRLKAGAAGMVYTTTLLASDDAGNLQGPDEAGTLAVGPFSTFVPLAQR